MSIAVWWTLLAERNFRRSPDLAMLGQQMKIDCISSRILHISSLRGDLCVKRVLLIECKSVDEVAGEFRDNVHR